MHTLLSSIFIFFIFVISYCFLPYSVFPQARLIASILSLRQSSFLSQLCLVPTCWLCFPSPSPQSGDTGGSGPPRCVFDHSCDLQQTCTCLRERKACMWQVFIHSRVEGGAAHPPAGFIKMPAQPP